MMITELMIRKSHKKGGGKRIPQTKTSLPVSQWFVSLHSWIPAQWLQTNSLPFGNVHLISTHKFSLSSLTISKSEFIRLVPHSNHQGLWWNKFWTSESKIKKKYVFWKMELKQKGYKGIWKLDKNLTGEESSSLWYFHSSKWNSATLEHPASMPSSSRYLLTALLKRKRSIPTKLSSNHYFWRSYPNFRQIQFHGCCHSTPHSQE